MTVGELSWPWPPRAAADPPPLPPGEIHLWLARLDAPVGAAAMALLAPEERTRAAAFRRPALSQAYLAAHLALRRLLGGYLRRAPAGIGLIRGPAGKPALRQGPGDAAPGLQFNLSHAGDWALLGFARGRAVGVDLEPLRPDPPLEAASLVFSPVERRLLDAQDVASRGTTFLRLWTRKEARLKAEGQGFSRDPTRLCTLSEQGWWIDTPKGPPDHLLAVAASARPARCLGHILSEQIEI
ncbi:4'-phosphopantetheinyl transferase family protein [Pseudoroseomonas sp. WGS1072]|uniref:4'-phosphopantetheinyl transferase family protein n=1 Tax=Roseomonas sp. WGS1072 TaxID=3366816 RepID=UPI003BF2975D